MDRPISGTTQKAQSCAETAMIWKPRKVGGLRPGEIVTVYRG
jgi:hypothetical protein